MTRWARALLGLCLVAPTGAFAQVPTVQAPVAPARAAPTARLTLTEALELGRRNSPAYRQFLNDAGPANWAVRNAYANLLPSFDVERRHGLHRLRRLDVRRLDLQSVLALAELELFARRSAGSCPGRSSSATGSRRRDRRATEARHHQRRGAAAQRHHGPVPDRPAGRGTDRGRPGAGAAQRRLPGLGAGPVHGRSGHHARRAAGRGDSRASPTSPCSGRSRPRTKPSSSCSAGWACRSPACRRPIALTDSFPVTEPQFDQEQLLALAQEENPSLKAFRAREAAATWGVRVGQVALPAHGELAAPACRASPRNSPTRACCSDQRLVGAQSTAENCQFQNALIATLPGGGVPGYPNGGIITDCNDFRQSRRHRRRIAARASATR